MKRLLILWILLNAAGAGWGQTKLQVVTRTVQKTVAWKPGLSVEINGEKAEVFVEPGTGDNIKVKAELTAKHPNIDTAKIDLEAWKFVVNTVGKKIYIRVYVGVPAKAPLPGSNLKARITVQTPASCPVNLVNKFGKAHLERLNGPVALSGDFCSFELVQLSGKVNVDSRYGDVAGENLSGPVSVQIKRADLDLTGLRNSCNVQSEYGNVELETTAQTGDVTVVSNKSDVTLQTKGVNTHNFDLKSSYGSVSVGQSLPFKMSDPDGHTRQAVLQAGAGRRLIKVVASFGKILVR